jgi:hypothetical protein
MITTTTRTEVETAIVQHLETQGSCTVETLAHTRSHFTFNPMDRLSREGRVSLRHPTRFTYSGLSHRFWYWHPGQPLS